MEQISVFDAKNKLSALLDKVERGASLIITRRGKPVARLVPAGPSDRAAESVLELKALRAGIAARGVSITQEEIRAWRDEGRK